MTSRVCLSNRLPDRGAFLRWAASVVLFAPELHAQDRAPAGPAVIVDASHIEATLRESVETNRLDIKVGESAVRGGLVRVGIIHRTRPETLALVHEELTEVYQIVAGGGVLITGGTAEEPRPVSDPPNLGSTPSFFVTQIGGESRRVGVGDIIIIPAGLPHRLVELEGPTSYMIFRFEATPAP
jgi:mannose-6-phosphate isomerase-like protein (cupin superfamily)